MAGKRSPDSESKPETTVSGAIPVNAADVARANKALGRHRANLLRRKGVVGVGVGFRVYERGGKRDLRRKAYPLATDPAHRGVDSPVMTNEVCIVVNVARKLAPDALKRGRALPDAIDGVPVDVVETRLADSQAVASCAHYDDPVGPGACIAAATGALGFATFGMVVQRGGLPYYLTVAHMMGRGYAGNVIQPSDPAAIPAGGSAVIGRGEPRFWSDRGQIDATLIEPSGARAAWAGLRAAPSIVGAITIRPGGPAADQLLGQPVEKVGAATGQTSGVVACVNKTYRIDGRTLTNQFAVRGLQGRFGDKGDSGAVVFQRDQAGASVVGLVHAFDAAADLSVACHFFLIRSRFAITV